MIILAILKDEIHVGKRGRAIGKEVRQRLAVGVDKYSVTLAQSSGKVPFTGVGFFPNLRFMEKRWDEFGIKPEKARATLQKALCKAFDRKLKGKLSLAELDKEFSVSEVCNDSSGNLMLYKRLRKRWGKGEIVILEEV